MNPELEQKKLQYKVRRVDLTDLCGSEGVELINEDGLSRLMATVCEMAFEGWKFTDCIRSEKDPCVIYLRFQTEV